MKTPKVRLYIRIRRTNGRDAYVDPVWNRNRTLRAGYAVVGGKAEHHAEGIYYLRYKRAGESRQWVAVGSDPDCALLALRNTEHDLQAIGLGRDLHPLPDSTAAKELDEESLLLDKAVQKYLAEIRRFRSAKTIAACENMLGRFNSGLPGKPLKKITREDLLNHTFALKQSGLGDRTIHNHICRIGSFLKAFDITGLLRTNDKPKYDEKAVSAYDSEELSRLFAVAEPEERLLFEFFLGTGFREQEVMYCTWANIDAKSKVVSVWSKPRWASG